MQLAGPRDPILANEMELGFSYWECPRNQLSSWIKQGNHPFLFPSLHINFPSWNVVMIPGGKAATLCHKDESLMLVIVEQEAKRTSQEAAAALTAFCRTACVLCLSHHGPISVTCRNQLVTLPAQRPAGCSEQSGCLINKNKGQSEWMDEASQTSEAPYSPETTGPELQT